MTPRLRTALWVQAQVRLCDIRLQGIAVAHKGDPDAGSVLLKLLRREGKCQLLRRVTADDGGHAWMQVGGGAEVEEEDARAYTERELKWDRDLWVVEIEDYDGRYELDGPLSD